MFCWFPSSSWTSHGRGSTVSVSPPPCRPPRGPRPSPRTFSPPGRPCSPALWTLSGNPISLFLWLNLAPDHNQHSPVCWGVMEVCETSRRFCHDYQVWWNGDHLYFAPLLPKQRLSNRTFLDTDLSQDQGSRLSKCFFLKAIFRRRKCLGSWGRISDYLGVLLSIM